MVIGRETWYNSLDINHLHSAHDLAADMSCPNAARESNRGEAEGPMAS